MSRPRALLSPSSRWPLFAAVAAFWFGSPAGSHAVSSPDGQTRAGEVIRLTDHAEHGGGMLPAEAAPGGVLPGRSPAIAVGEKLIYSVRWGMVRAGVATLETTGIQRVGGRRAYHIVSTAVSNAVFDKIYPVRDRYESLMDHEHLYSHYFEKHLREGRYRADQLVRFDHVRGVATYHDKREFPIEPGSFDVLAAFYYVRTMPLEVGRTFYLNSHADRKSYPIKVTVLSREEVETPAGTFSCFVVEPTLRSGAFFKHEGQLTIWLSDDERRLPVMMRSRIPVGSISVHLVEYRRPDSSSPAAAEATP